MTDQCNASTIALLHPCTLFYAFIRTRAPEGGRRAACLRGGGMAVLSGQLGSSGVELQGECQNAIKAFELSQTLKEMGCLRLPHQAAIAGNGLFELYA